MRHLVFIAALVSGLSVQAATQPTVPGMANWAQAKLVNYRAAKSNIVAGLVGWWKMDEGSGTTTADSSGNGRTGTFSGSVTWTNGIIGSSGLYFQSSYLTVTNAGFYPSGTSPFTISLWTKVNPQTSRMVAWNDGTYSIQFGVTATGTFYIYDRSSTASMNQITSFSPTTNQWHHITTTYNGVSTWNIYVDGSLANGGTGSLLGIYTSDTSLYIGQLGGPSNMMIGFLDDLRIYSRALSPAEITTIYQWRP